MRVFCASICFLFAGLALPAVSNADCKIALVDFEASAQFGLRIMGANGRLPHFVSFDGRPFRVAAGPSSGGKLYFTEAETFRISSSDLDGGNKTVILTRSLSPYAIAVYQSRIYWTEDTSNFNDSNQGKIVRADLDGGNVGDVVTGLTNPVGLAFGSNGKMYWTTATVISAGVNLQGKVFSAMPDGTAIQEIANLNTLSAANNFSNGSSSPFDIAVDNGNQKLFIADSINEESLSPHVIWRTNLDGSDGELFTTANGCSGSGGCLKTTSSLAINEDTDSLLFSSRGGIFNGLFSYDSINGGLRYLVSASNGTGLELFGSDQGLCNPSGNLTGSLHSNFTVWRPSTGIWFERENSVSAPVSVRQWGLPSDIPLLGNFNGDTKTDIVVWRPNEGNWYLCDWDGAGNCKTTEVVQWGLPGDFPVVADFDGDSLSDITVWRPSTGTWYNRPALGAYTRQWGLPGDLPLAGDFNNDGKDDFVVWRPSTGTWFVLYSSFTGPQPDASVTVVRQWGLPGDRPLIGDYDADGKPDLAVWRPASGNWYICKSTTTYDCAGQGTTVQFGLPGDIPVAADFDGDGITDFSIWRPSEGNWYHRDSSNQQISVQQWGLPGDFPAGRTVSQLSNVN